MLLILLGKMIQQELPQQGHQAEPDGSRFPIRQAFPRTTTGPHIQATHWFQLAEEEGMLGVAPPIPNLATPAFTPVGKRVPPLGPTKEDGVYIFLTINVNIHSE